MTLRLALLNALKPLTEEIGGIHAPYSHRKVVGAHYYYALPKLQPGMPLLSRKEGELSNIVINAISQGEYTHAAVYCGVKTITIEGQSFSVPYVVEAVARGVVPTDLATFMLTKDRVAACLPNFVTESEMGMIASWCESKKGLPYDTSFDPKNKAFYCSELWWQGYVAVTGKNDVFTKRLSMGVQTVAPQDYRNATNKFSIVFETDRMPFGPEVGLLS